MSDFKFPDVEQFIDRAGRGDEPVLLQGETGTGKTRIAQRIHATGARSSGPWIPVNCTSIPESLFERELLGHVRGAFTDAKQSREGLIEAANRGTLFLDEIGELPLPIQPKLLSVLENDRIRRVGSTREIPVDIRVIAATNRDMDRALARGEFRRDLYYRIAVLRFFARPLRNREADLVELINHMLRRLLPRSRPVEIAPEALDMMRRHPWPGNLRELENTLRAALAMGDGPVIGAEHVALIPSDPVVVKGWGAR